MFYGLSQYSILITLYLDYYKDPVIRKRRSWSATAEISNAQHCALMKEVVGLIQHNALHDHTLH